MSAEILLNQLHKVRKSGPGKWMARCPAHDDRSPSLAVTEGADGHILIHCFAGCEPYEILASVGLQMSDLFPDRDQHYFDDRPPVKHRETRNEALIANLEFRVMTFMRMLKLGYQAPPEEIEARRKDYQKLQSLKGAA